MQGKKTVTILSGGMDSTTLVYLLRAQGHDQQLISFDYGQRHRKELDCAATTAEKLNLPHQIVDLKGVTAMLKGSSLTDNVTVPDGHYAEDNMRLTVVPGRNAMMLSVAWAAGAAEGVNYVACGVHQGDYLQYPDCRKEFITVLDAALRLGTAGLGSPHQHLLTPFITKDKAEIVEAGIRLKVPYGDSWTCYKGRELACGLCGACTERLEAFASNNTEDPVQYEDDKTWRKAVAEFKAKHATTVT